MDKRNASNPKNSATFPLTGWRLSHPTDLPSDLPVTLQCHTLAMNTIELQTSACSSALPNSIFCSSIPTLWQTMLLTHWPPQPQYDRLTTLKRKSLYSTMDGLQRREDDTTNRPLNSSEKCWSNSIKYLIIWQIIYTPVICVG